MPASRRAPGWLTSPDKRAQRHSARVRTYLLRIDQGAAREQREDENRMKARGTPRIPVQGTITFSRDQTVGRGRVTDLSTSGCVVESDHQVSRGDYIAIRLRVPGEGPPLETDLAAIRWAMDGRFGLEFIRISNLTQSRIRLLTMATFVRVHGKDWTRTPM